MNLVKLFSLVTLFQDVTVEVQKAGMEKRPWYLQRTVWGALIALVSGSVAAYTGVTLDAATLSSIADNIPQLATVGISLYGAVLMIFGAIMKAVKAARTQA